MLSKRYLKFASFNVEGLRNKLDDINFKNEISMFDFIILVETWLPADEQVNLEGHTSFFLYRRKHPRAKPASGGITLLVKEQMFQGVTICKCDDDRFLWWKLDRNFFGLTDDIFVCSVYGRIRRRRMSQNQTKTALIALSLSVTSFPTSVKKGKLFFTVTFMHALETWTILQKMSLGSLIVD